jgi:hypothetical protein
MNDDGKKCGVKKGSAKAAVLQVTLCALLLAGTATAALAQMPNFPDYLKTAKETNLDNLRGMRYCEIFFMGVDPSVKDVLIGQVFNTSELNNKSNPLDTCPEAIWAKINPESLKQQYGGVGVFKNGPRGWTIDTIHNLPISHDVRTFEGLEARWFMTVELPKDFAAKTESTYYKPVIGRRSNSFTFHKGKPVFILEDPTGTPWLMQAWSNIVDPNLTYEGLQTLDTKLKLPPGWKYRVKVLDQELTVKTINGKARITQDDLENTYDACYEEGGQKTCSTQP